MGGFNDHVAVLGDWLPSPSPRSLFSSIVDSEYRSGALFPGPQELESSGNDDQKVENRSSLGDDEAKMVETKFSSSGGLMERIAARAGFNAPRLNTQGIRTADISKNPEVRSPYVAISPSLSPTTLLESPVFLSNSMVLPSPTTGNFSFAQFGNNHNPTPTRDDSDKGEENTQEDANASSFAFKPVSESAAFPSFSSLHYSNFSKSYKDNYGGNSFSQEQTLNSVGVGEQSPPFDEDDGARTFNGDPNVSEDGFNWRKYGQKHVKGSEHPRSYYKCTHLNCPVKKKVERSQEGHIMEIIYKGAHNHPKPPPNQRAAVGAANEHGGVPLDCEQPWKPQNLETTTSTVPLCQEYGNGVANSNLQAQNEPGDSVDVSSTFSNNEEEDRAAHGSASLGGYDGEGDELESKRRRIETYAPDMSGATRAIREPRVVVQTTSEVDILDDGYRWRKYGQKVVKGNPNPRSYYKCTSPGCNVRKHVERACHDLKSVITTYEGKHNHDVPAARNTAQQGPSNINRPDPGQIRANTTQFVRPSLASFNLPNRAPQMGPGPGFRFGMNHQHATGFNPYLGHPVSEMGYGLPKGEAKLEPVTENGLSSSMVYQQQMMNRMPLGPHM